MRSSVSQARPGEFLLGGLIFITQSLEEIKANSFLCTFHPQLTLESGLWHLTHPGRERRLAQEEHIRQGSKAAQDQEGPSTFVTVPRAELAWCTPPSLLGALCSRRSQGKSCTKGESTFQPPFTAYSVTHPPNTDVLSSYHVPEALLTTGDKAVSVRDKASDHFTPFLVWKIPSFHGLFP